MVLPLPNHVEQRSVCKGAVGTPNYKLWGECVGDTTLAVRNAGAVPATDVGAVK